MMERKYLTTADMQRKWGDSYVCRPHSSECGCEDCGEWVADNHDYETFVTRKELEKLIHDYVAAVRKYDAYQASIYSPSRGSYRTNITDELAAVTAQGLAVLRRCVVRLIEERDEAIDH